MQMNIKWKIQKILGLFGYKVTKDFVPDPVIDTEKEFIDIYEKCKDYTMTSKEKMYSLYKVTKYIIKANILGDFVECGVWRGGSAMLIAHTLLRSNVTDRKIYLYDTFEGMTEPAEIDNYIFADKWKEDQEDGHSTWCYASLDEVKNNMSKTKYPENKMIYVKGKVEDTIPRIIPEKIALLRLDTDWYDSSKHELIHLFPILTKNGALIIDDYGLSVAGQRKAVDEYFSDKNIMLNRIDQFGVIGIKTDL